MATNYDGEEITMVVDNKGSLGSAGSIGVGVSVLSGASETDENGCPSVPASVYDDGPVGVVAGAAIVPAKKRKRLHSFERNPSMRRRQELRLLQKLRKTIDEFAIRVGQQAVVILAAPRKPNTSYNVFGARPLEDVIKNLRAMIMEDLESALAQQAAPPVVKDSSLFELPPLIIDGTPTPIEKMSQAQLRAFIPLMLKYSTGRGKLGWGKKSTRPLWWPKELPWANVRMDTRTVDEKQKVSWSNALRQVVINCYKYHKREDLLFEFSEENVHVNAAATANTNMGGNTYSAVLETIKDEDGSISILQEINPNNSIIILPDGTTAQVQGLVTEPGGTVVQGLLVIPEGTTALQVQGLVMVRF